MHKQRALFWCAHSGWTGKLRIRYSHAMIDPKLLDELANRLHASLPTGLRTLQSDLDQSLHLAIQSALAKLDLVTREEFDVQAKVLARTRQKLEQLTQRIAALEAGSAGSPVSPSEQDPTPKSEQDMDGG